MDARRFCTAWMALALCAMLLTALLLLVSGPALAADTPRYVATTGQNTGSCDSRGAACATVQYAVDQADPGDSIRVAGGTYAGVLTRPVPAGYNGSPASGVLTQVVFLTKTVHVEGGYAAPLFVLPPDPVANPTILDAGGQGRVIMVADSADPTFQGLTISGGDASGLGGDGYGNDVGGGIHIDQTTVAISNTRVVSNTADRGGGIFAWTAYPSIIASEILSNTAPGGGGGIHAHSGGHTIVVDSAFRYNRGASGGAVALIYSGGELRGSAFTANTATGNGGAMRLTGSSGTTLEGNTIAGNTAGNGGGLHIEYNSQVRLVNNVLAGNQASGNGSGIHVQRAKATLLHTTIVDHRQGDGSGLYLSNVASNYATALLTNTIVASNTIGIYAQPGNTVTLEATLWHGNGAVTGGGGSVSLRDPNVYRPPGFVSLNGLDFHLTSRSAAVDAGVDAGVINDIDGQERPMNEGFDLGADEAPWVTWLYLPAVLRASP